MSRLVDNVDDLRWVVSLADDVDVLFFLAEHEEQENDHKVITDYAQRYAELGAEGLEKASRTDSRETVIRKARLNAVRIMEAWCRQAREEMSKEMSKA